MALVTEHNTGKGARLPGRVIADAHKLRRRTKWAAINLADPTGGHQSLQILMLITQCAGCTTR